MELLGGGGPGGGGRGERKGEKRSAKGARGGGGHQFYNGFTMTDDTNDQGEEAPEVACKSLQHRDSHCPLLQNHVALYLAFSQKNKNLVDFSWEVLFTRYSGDYFNM